MPEIDVENRKETGIWKFETTPRMSSYLLAFVAGDLQGVTAKTKNGTLCRCLLNQSSSTIKP